MAPSDNLLPPPAVSVRTVHMAGLLVDVHGLDEMPPLTSGTARVTCLWLHHQRLRSKEHMADTAARCVAAWNARARSPAAAAPATANTGDDANRALIALAFDQRNHGSRLVHALANESWKKGNATHAQDMFGIIAGAVADQRVLM